MESSHGGEHPPIRDYGPSPFVFDLCHAATKNTNFRTTLWTGEHMQLTVMCIPPSGDIGVEIHTEDDQMIGVAKGYAKVYMGRCRNSLCEKATVHDNDVIFVPAGTWHNVVNVGNEPLKLYSVYSPPHHPAGTIHKCKADAMK